MSSLASATFSGRVLAAGGVEEVFPLFSPDGERLWVPGWDPEILHPPGGEWTEGQVFTTREETGEAVWVVTRHDPVRHRAEYHRVEPGRYVARVRVACRPNEEGETEVSIAYSYFGLSAAGSREIEAMTEEAYAEKMVLWTRWLEEHLAGTGGR